MLATERDFDLFAACFAANGAERSRQALTWQYRDNPVGQLWAHLAIAEAATGSGKVAERIAAVYATLPVHVRVGGERRVALQSLDTLTDSAFRGRGLFVKLARSTFVQADQDGLAFVYGFPNKNSAPGFFGKLGWSSLDPLPFLIRPLRSRYIAEKLWGAKAARLPDLRLMAPTRRARGGERGAQEVTRFDERFTRLWSSFSTRIRVAVERDATYLNWRLIDKPEHHYRRLAIFEGDEVAAFVAFSLKDKHGGRVGSILELMHAPGRAADARRLLELALRELADGGADVALAWCLPHSPNFTTYLRGAFLPFPERMRPIELHFGVRAFDGRTSAIVGDRRNWYISYLDSDTI